MSRLSQYAFERRFLYSGRIAHTSDKKWTEKNKEKWREKKNSKCWMILLEPKVLHDFMLK
jgi:hypothetical protein